MSCKKITLETVKEADVFKSIKAYYDCKNIDELDFFEQMLLSNLSTIVNMVKTFHLKYKIDLDEIASQCFLLFFECCAARKGREFSKQNIYKFIYFHLQNYCKTHVTPPATEQGGTLEYEAFEFEEEKIALKALLAALPKEESDVLRLRFGFFGPEMTNQEIAKCYGIDKAKIRQLELRAFYHIKRGKYFENVKGLRN